MTPPEHGIDRGGLPDVTYGRVREGDDIKEGLLAGSVGPSEVDHDRSQDLVGGGRIEKLR